MEKPLDKDERHALLEEIRTRVFERYAEIQGVETQESELRATLDALHEITSIPMEEIESIASGVMRRDPEVATPPPASPKPKRQDAQVAEGPTTEFVFGPLRQKMLDGKRRFMNHLIPFCFVNGLLIVLNLMTSSFPWAMFPLVGWGIGLVSHYLQDVHWPKADVRNTISSIKSQIHQILSENIPAYGNGDKSRIFQGVYRLLATESSKENLKEYLRNTALDLPERDITQVATQLQAVQQQYFEKL